MYLIIYAHPNKEGHCGVILKQVKTILQKKNYQVLDLYYMEYDPVVRQNEITKDAGIIPTRETKVFHKMIKNSKLIFIYPNWWGSMPAILKGFIDRTLTNKFAYEFKGQRPIGLLKNKAVVFTTNGSPLFLLKLLGNRPKKAIKKDILGFCGIKPKVVQFGSCRKMRKEKIKEINNRVNKEMKDF